MKFLLSIFFLASISSMTYAADVCVISANSVTSQVQESCNGDSVRSAWYPTGNTEVIMSRKLKVLIDQGYTLVSCGAGSATRSGNTGPTMHCTLTRN